MCPRRNCSAQARRLLNSKLGRTKYKQRSVEVEPVFGNTFYNKSRRRFWLRGLHKVDIEAGIAFIAQNIAKIHLHLLKIRQGPRHILIGESTVS